MHIKICLNLLSTDQFSHLKIYRFDVRLPWEPLEKPRLLLFLGKSSTFGKSFSGISMALRGAMNSITWEKHPHLQASAKTFHPHAPKYMMYTKMTVEIMSLALSIRTFDARPNHWALRLQWSQELLASCSGPHVCAPCQGTCNMLVISDSIFSLHSLYTPWCAVESWSSV